MRESSSHVAPAILRYDGHHDYWSVVIENFLRSKEFQDVVGNGIGKEDKKNKKTKHAARKLMDLKVKNYFFQAIDQKVLKMILCKDTSKVIWDSMRKKFAGYAQVKKAQLQALRRKLELLQMTE